MNDLTALYILVAIMTFLFMFFLNKLFVRTFKIIKHSRFLIRVREMLDMKRKYWNLNPLIIFFGIIAIFVIYAAETIYEWCREHSFACIMILVNVVMLTPMVLAASDVVQKLPEFYFPLFIIYLMFMLGLLAARGDTRGHYHNHYNRYDDYPNNRGNYGYNGYNGYNEYPVYVKHKPRGISESEAKKKKKIIRENLLKDEDLKKKYSL
jgi:hypothetical protein